MTLEEIESIENFASKIDKLELPNQLAAAIDNSLLQTLLVIKPSGSLVPKTLGKPLILIALQILNNGESTTGLLLPCPKNLNTVDGTDSVYGDTIY